MLRIFLSFYEEIYSAYLSDLVSKEYIKICNKTYELHKKLKRFLGSLNKI